MFFVKKYSVYVFAITILCVNSVYSMSTDKQQNTSVWQSLKHAGAFYATDFALYAAQRTINPMQLIRKHSPEAVNKAAADACVKAYSCAQMYQEINRYVAPLIDHSTPNGLTRAWFNPWTQRCALVLGSNEPEREVHRLLAQSVADAIVPHAEQSTNALMKTVGHGVALARYRTVKQYVLWTRQILTTGLLCGIQLPIPYLYEMVLFPEIAAEKAANAFERVSPHMRVVPNSTGEFIINYTTQQVRRDLPQLIMHLLRGLDGYVERSLGAAELSTDQRPN